MSSSPFPLLPPIHNECQDQKATDRAAIKVAECPDLCEQDDAQLLVSLRVCKSCQTSLMKVFDHCLSRHTACSDSWNEIDEIADSKLTSRAPYYEIVRDPTILPNKVFGSGDGGVERDRAVFYESQHLKKLTAKGPNIGKSKFFSGALYKRTIEAKDREIKQLREKLYDATAQSRMEHQNVQNLKVALNKSMKYYCYAEEWQHHESERLQQDVRNLKAEMSSLMAFLINSEEEKRMMLIEMENIRNTSQEKDDEKNAIEHQRDQYKEKLQQAYEEYLATNEIIAKLREEAEHGSDVIISRNEVLQRNIDKISRDFEVTAKDLSAANLKIKDLQFELDEMVQQFNITGQGQKAAEELNVRLGNELEQLKVTYNELKHLQTETAMHVVELEKHIKDLEQLLEVTRTELENQAADLRNDLHIVTEMKKDLEGHLKSSRQEVEKLSMGLKSLSRSKDQIETAFRVAVQKHEKELQFRDDQIKDLQKMREQDDVSMKKLQEQKEQLMFQVTDLQNNLDRELSNVNVLSFELSQLKRISEEKIFVLEEQVEKLNNAKVNLATDKRTLADKLKTVRSDLQEREEKLAKITQDFADFRVAAAAKESNLATSLNELDKEHVNLKSDFKTLKQTQEVLVESNLELVVTQENLKKQLKVAEGINVVNLAEITTLKLNNKELAEQLEISVADKGELKIHLDSVLQKLSETVAVLNREREESSNTIKEKTEHVIKLSSDLYRVSEDRTRLDTLSLLLQSQVRNLESELSDTKAKLAAEIFNKEQFEVHLYEVRMKLLSERSLRMDFERMNSRIDRMLASKELEKLAAMKARDRKLLEVSKHLAEEHARLQGIGALLPTSEFLQTTDAPEIPDFHDDGKVSKPSHKRDAKSPDIKVTITQKR
ncbi:hypothetical protein HDU82_001794 [Entophlyctis luteolus]|nr:hypothetical protein HDU82_001794 [Entophlyctis luteolus]KAJ3390396.1 hypothetical protein HDU84_007526 [Entophlyctis sp. JEL0112]